MVVLMGLACIRRKPMASVLGIVVVASFSVEGGQPDCGYSIECCVLVLCFFMLLCSLFIEQSIYLLYTKSTIRGFVFETPR
jgi:hypothetical protein